jgi:hypothetical protein
MGFAPPFPEAGKSEGVLNNVDYPEQWVHCYEKIVLS